MSGGAHLCDLKTSQRRRAVAKLAGSANEPPTSRADSVFSCNCTKNKVLMLIFGWQRCFTITGRMKHEHHNSNVILNLKI